MQYEHEILKQSSNNSSIECTRRLSITCENWDDSNTTCEYRTFVHIFTKSMRIFYGMKEKQYYSHYQLYLHYIPLNIA